MFNANNIITVTAQRAWKPLEVTVKATGKRAVIKDFRFDPDLYENAKVVGESRVAPIPSTPVVVNADDVPIDKVSVDEVPVISVQERFTHLKNKGWRKLDWAERQNYRELKDRLYPKKNDDNTKTTESL